MLPSQEILEKQFGSFKEIENSLRECNFIKYAAYRSAAKLRIIQKALHMDKVHLRIIANVFEKHQLQQTENCVLLDQSESLSVLSDIYFAAQKESETELNVDSALKFMILFLFSVYDKKIKNVVQVLSLKIGLTLLCQAKPREKYHYLFYQLADHNNCLSRKKLEILLKKMISLTEYVGEGLSFGSDLISGTVESCFQSNIGTLGITEDGFINWLMQDPQLLVWVSTFYRMQISEKVCHNVKCSLCKIFPLIGLRYRCLRCLSYDMCQVCFFTGKINKKHKLKHPVQEYCCPMTSQQYTKAFLLTLKNRLYKTDSKLQYLPAIRVDSDENDPLGQSTRLLDQMEISSRTLVNGSRVSLHKFPDKELDSIITHLEKETEKLVPQIENLFLNSDSDYSQSQLKNFINRHRNQVKVQIQRLKLLRNYYLLTGKFETKAFLASTPVEIEPNSKFQKRAIRNDFDNFSPIITPKNTTRCKENTSRKMMWDNYDFANHGIEATWEEVKSKYLNGNVLDGASEVCLVNEPLFKDDGSGSSLSTWLGGEELKDVDSSSKRGLTWLKDETLVNNPTDGSWKENKEELEGLQNDFKEILNKLQELSVVTSFNGDKEEDKMQAAVEVDTLLVELINGIEKLLEN